MALDKPQRHAKNDCIAWSITSAQADAHTQLFPHPMWQDLMGKLTAQSQTINQVHQTENIPVKLPSASALVMWQIAKP